MTTMVVISIMIIWITLMIAPKFFSRFFPCEYVNSMLSGPSAWVQRTKPYLLIYSDKKDVSLLVFDDVAVAWTL